VTPQLRGSSSSLLVTCLAFLAASSAWGQPARVTVTPTSLSLTRADGAGAVTLTNRGAEATDFQVTAHQWHGTDGSALQLEPSTDLVVAPGVFRLEPGQSRRVRVLARVTADRVERAYRLSVTQLPAATSTANPGVAMLMQLSLPVFVTAPRATARVDVEAPRLHRGRLQFALHNRGTATLTPRALQVRLLDAREGLVRRQMLETWYLLPGERRQVDLPLEPGDCGRIVAIAIELGAPLAPAMAAVPAGDVRSCAP
jgi:fimbrial chaperone protein